LLVVQDVIFGKVESARLEPEVMDEVKRCLRK